MLSGHITPIMYVCTDVNMYACMSVCMYALESHPFSSIQFDDFPETRDLHLVRGLSIATFIARGYMLAFLGTYFTVR